jgi:23S rRNA (adenine2030-N6)-methyltransferase
LKHAVLLALLERLTGDRRSLAVIDTHAGGGLYDLQDERASRSREAQAGIGRLMQNQVAPPVLHRLMNDVRSVNGAGELRWYPGSPLLTIAALRPGDRYIGYELRPDDQRALSDLLKRRTPRGVQAEARCGDGYGALVGAPKCAEGHVLYLIDPPFERGDEYANIVHGVGSAGQADANATFAIWTPIKDLETFDALLRRLEDLRIGGVTVAEVRLRPLQNPMILNGCAMILLRGPDVTEAANAACVWIAARCGALGASGRVYSL